VEFLEVAVLTHSPRCVGADNPVTVADLVSCDASSGWRLLAKTANACVARPNYAAAQGTARTGAHFTRVMDKPGLAAIIARGREAAETS
jgi:hypothetical protein